MSLYKRGGVYWTYIWVDGVRHARSTRTGNVRQARLVDQAFKEELTLARYHPHRLQPDLTFGELAVRFLAEGMTKPHHHDRLKVLLPYFRETPIGRISRSMTRDYRKHRHEQKAISETTVNRDLEVLRHLLFWAVDEGLLAANPLSRMPMVRERRKPRPILTLEDESRLLAAAAPHLQAIIIAALDTGMRRGELLSQLWEHIDFTRRLLSVTHSKTAGGEAREIPLTTRCCELLTAMRKPDGLVFRFRDRPVRRIKTAWKAAIRRAGIRYHRFHDLRHTFNTRLLEAGVMQEVRKALMGHSSGEDVHAIYTHVELPLKRDAIHKLEEWVAREELKREKEREANGRSGPTESRGSNGDLQTSESTH